MVASMLQAGGYRVGLYTSPHLVDFRERIRVDGELMTPDAVVDWTERLHAAMGETLDHERINAAGIRNYERHVGS
jgi:dihydrofolate synthase/folylpolyglutamate synthase